MKRIVVAFAALALAACTAMPQKSVVQNETLYQSLGGRHGVERLVDAAVRRLFDDRRINAFFTGSNPDESRRLIAEHICELSGGGCAYTFRTKDATHSGMSLSDADFEAFIEDFIVAMNEVKVPVDAQRQVLQLFVALRPQIIGQ